MACALAAGHAEGAGQQRGPWELRGAHGLHTFLPPARSGVASATSAVVGTIGTWVVPLWAQLFSVPVVREGDPAEGGGQDQGPRWLQGPEGRESAGHGLPAHSSRGQGSGPGTLTPSAPCRHPARLLLGTGRETALFSQGSTAASERPPFPPPPEARGPWGQRHVPRTAHPAGPVPSSSEDSALGSSLTPTCSPSLPTLGWPPPPSGL